MTYRILNLILRRAFMGRNVLASLVGALLLSGAGAQAWRPAAMQEIVDLGAKLGRRSSSSLPAAGTIEVAFSPDEGAEELVVKVIDSARREIRVLAYSFTSAKVSGALIRAVRRGVDVKVVADHKINASEDNSGKARAALSALATAGAEVRTIAAYAAAHDKIIVVDAQTIELGSFNFSDSAARRNSENVLVNWNNPALAEVYLRHFARNFRQSSPFVVRY